MLSKISCLTVFCGLALVLTGGTASGSTVSGRITIGTYDGIETLAQSSGGSNSNDVSTFSGRFFLRVADIGANRFEFVSDIRDKNDLFGALDSKNLQLVNANTLQFRQLSGLYPGSVFFTEVGRFPVLPAGAVYTDGALQGAHLSKNLSWAAFGGLDPKLPEQTFVQFNSNAEVFGTYFTYISPRQDWDTSFVIDTAAVTDIVQSSTDRTYWYTSTIYQWNPRSRFSLLSYLDFVPNTYLQNGTVNYQQALSPKCLFALNLFTIGALEYQRLQSVREQLTSSPYQEAGGKFRFNPTPTWALEVATSSGFRSADGLHRAETSLTSDFLRVWGRHWDVSAGLGYRDNFASIDDFGMARLFYFSNLWEFGLDEQFEFEEYKNGGYTYHPLISEISASRTFDNSLYGTFSYQDVRDERVQISTVFLKLSYRFGSKEVPPVRDGAPPRGRL